MKYRFVVGLFALSACFSAFGGNDASIQCADDDFDCYRLEPDHVVLKESNPSEIFYKGRVIALHPISTKVTHRVDPLAELPGHTTVRRYSGKGISVTVEEVIKETSCWERNESGGWEESEKCCGGESSVKVSVTEGKDTKRFLGQKHFGL